VTDPASSERPQADELALARDEATAPDEATAAVSIPDLGSAQAPDATPGSTPDAAPSPTPALAPPPIPTPKRSARRRFRIRGVRGPVEILIRALLIANVAVIAVLLIVVLTSGRDAAGHPDQALPSESIDLMSMGLAHIPTSASCLLCHESGGSGGLKPIPAIGHPLEGWRRCVTCHTNESLGRKAPGHQDIPEEECLNCHKLPPEGPAITQPHSRLQDQHCLDCHGTYAHLPSSMVGRNQDECWLCHKPTELPPPEYPHEPGTAVGCRECHQSAQTGGLPIDHARRENSTCLLCHDIKSTGPLPLITPSPDVTLPPLLSPSPSS